MRPPDPERAAAPTEVEAGERVTGDDDSHGTRRVRQSLGASLEVIEHHARRHADAGCRAVGAAEQVCPCGTTVVLVCGCGSPQFVAVSPGTWCPHAESAARGEL